MKKEKETLNEEENRGHDPEDMTGKMNDFTENAGSPENQENTDLQRKTDELNAKLADINDKYVRLYSEYDNFRKRTAKEKIELIKTAGEDVLKSILPVIDDFERALKQNHESAECKAIGEGVQLIYNKFKNALAQKGLEEMQAIGKSFDADLHEAITSVPATSEDMKGKVVDELEKGYYLNGKVIRFAKVVIAK